MQNFSFVETLKRKWQVLFLVTMLAVVTTFVISVLQVPKYKSSVSILITQRYGANTDIYAAQKFTEYLSNLLEQVIYSKSFFDQVMTSGYGVNNDFPASAEKRAAEWHKEVQTKVVSDTGIISIDVFNKDRDQADKLSNAIANVLVTKSDEYDGAGAQVQLKVIDGPSTTEKTASPNLPINLLIGLALGLVLGGIFIYIFPTLYWDDLLPQRKESVPFVTPVAPASAPADEGRDFGQSTDLTNLS